MEQKDIDYMIDAHTNYAKKPSKKFRKFDGKTSYWAHPLWCATTILAETSLEEKLRNEGALTLLYHDIFEDTTAQLPPWLSDKIKKNIADMTFTNYQEEIEKIWAKPKEIRLYKLCDKVHNLLDGSWMDEMKRIIYKNYTEKLCANVERSFGELNIIKIARQIT